MPYKTKIVLMTLGILLVILACSFVGMGDGRVGIDVSRSTNTSKSTFTNKTETVLIELEVKPDMQSNVLRIDNFKLNKGEVTLRLFQPESELIEKEVLGAPAEYRERFELEVVPGLWALEIEMRDASGSYDIKWDAEN